MNLNSTSSSAASTFSSHGFSGFSGIDTESIVEKMLMTQQTRINKQMGLQTQLTWKQQLYRDVIDKVNAFKDKYFSAASSSYIGNTNLYDTVKLSSSNTNAVTVTGNPEKMGENFSVQVAQLAAAAKTEGSKVSGGIDFNPSDIKLDPKDWEVEFTFGIPKMDGDFHAVKDNEMQYDQVSLKVNLQGANTEEEKIRRINEAIKDNAALCDEDGNPMVTVEQDTETNVFSYSGEFGLKIGENSGSLGLAALGLTKDSITTVGSYKLIDPNDEDSGYLKDDDGNMQIGNFKLVGTAMNNDPQYSVSVDLDGVKKWISFSYSEIEAAQNSTEGAKALSENFAKKIKESFGSSIKVDIDDTTGGFKLSTGTGQKVTLGGDSDVLGIKSGTSTNFSISNKMGDLFGFKGQMVDVLDSNGDPVRDKDGNIVQKEETVIKSFDINGKKIEYNQFDTVQSIMDKVNKSGANVTMSYNTYTDSFTLTSNVTGAGENNINISNDEEGVFDKLNLTGSNAKKTDGQNAIVNYNGQIIERTVNSFSIGEANLTLLNTTGDYGDLTSKNVKGEWNTAGGSADNKATVSYNRNSTNAVNIMKSFVEDYNKLIEDLNKFTNAEPTYKKYPPLSDTQKKEMSDKEIELWEEQAKIGLLRHDPEITSFLSSMRNTLNSTFGGVSLAIMGIDTSKNWNDNGKLEFDEDKFKNCVENYGKSVYEFLRGADGKGGLCAKMNEVINHTANRSSSDMGTLVRIAGVKGYGSEQNNEIFSKLKSYNTKITDLKTQYEKRKAVLWKQFTGMERSLSSMNNQASWLQSYSG